MLQGQRTQVYTEVQLREFLSADKNDDDNLVVRHLAGKESAKYGPTTAIFPPEEATAAQYFIEHLRKHLPHVEEHDTKMGEQKLLLPNVRRYASQQDKKLNTIFGEDVAALMGNRARN